MLKFNLFNSIKEIKQDISFSSTIFLKQEYLISLEEAAPSGLSFKYVVIEKRGIPIGLFYFQVINLSSKDIGQIIHFEPYSKLMSGISMMIQNILFGVKKDKPHFLLICGNMCLSGEFGIASANDQQGHVIGALPDVISEVTHELDKVGKVIAHIIKDFPQENDPVKSLVKGRKYNSLVMDPIMKMEIRSGWSSMEDYLKDLSAKYRQRYNQAFKKLQDCTIKDLNLQEMIKEQERLDQLYKAVQEKSPIQLIKPDATYLISLKKHLKDKMVFKAIYHEGKIVAFLSGINAVDHYEAHHIGIDYHYNKSHSLYLNILYLYIGLAIDSKARTLSFGRTALEMKTTVGGIPIQYDAYIKLSSGMLNSLIKHLLPEKPDQNWIPRNPFRQ